MTVIELGAFGEFIGSILTIATLTYLAIQVRLHNAQQRREASVAIERGQNAVLEQLQEPAMARAYALVARDGRAAPIADRTRAIIWVVRYLNHFQIVSDLHRDGTLDDERFELWAEFAIAFVAPKGIREWWDDEAGKFSFMPDVRDLIDRRLEDRVNPPRPMSSRSPIFDANTWEQSGSELNG